MILLSGIFGTVILGVIFTGMAISDHDQPSVFFVGTVINAILLGFFIGAGVADNKWEKRAVQNNYAEYYLDKDNNKQWRWIDKKE